MSLTGGDMLLKKYNDSLQENMNLLQRNLALLNDKQDLIRRNEIIEKKINDLEESIKKLIDEKENQDKIIQLLLKNQTERKVKTTDILLFIIINLITIHLFYFIIIYNNNINIVMIRDIWDINKIIINRLHI